LLRRVLAVSTAFASVQHFKAKRDISFLSVSFAIFCSGLVDDYVAFDTPARGAWGWFNRMPNFYGLYWTVLRGVSAALLLASFSIVLGLPFGCKGRLSIITSPGSVLGGEGRFQHLQTYLNEFTFRFNRFGFDSSKLCFAKSFMFAR
jgi:hypothetical protein